MDSDKICAFWHQKQFGNVVIKFEKGPIVGYVNSLDDGKYQFIVTPEFKFDKILFSNILCRFGIILTESTNLKDIFNKYLYKCVTTNDIPSNINTILTPLNKNGSILTNFVEVLAPYNLFIGTLLQKQNGFKINYEIITYYCMENELFTKDDKPNILQFCRLLFGNFHSSDFEKMKIKVETQDEPTVGFVIKKQEVNLKTQELKVEVITKMQEVNSETDAINDKVNSETQDIDDKTKLQKSNIETKSQIQEPNDNVNLESQKPNDDVNLESQEPIDNDNVKTEDINKQVQLSEDECKLLIFIAEFTGHSLASIVIGNAIQCTNKTQELIDAITLIQKILSSHNHADFNLTRLVFNKFY